MKPGKWVWLCVGAAALAQCGCSKSNTRLSVGRRAAAVADAMVGLRQGGDVLTVAARADWPRTWNDLQQRRRQMRQQVRSRQSTSAGAWNDLRQRTDRAWNRMYDAVKQARQRLRSNERHPQPRPDTIRR